MSDTLLVGLQTATNSSESHLISIKMKKIHFSFDSEIPFIEYCKAQKLDTI